MIYLFLAILIGAIIVVGGQYIFVNLLEGRFEGDKTTYNRAMSFNKTLNKKMKYYPNKNVTYFKIYMNVVLPVFTIFLAKQAVDAYPTLSVSLAGFLIPLVLAVIMLVNTIFFRFIDKLSYWFNLVALLLWLSVYIAGFITSGYFDVFLLPAIVLCLFFTVNIVYFTTRRELFFCSAKQLKKLYYDEED